MACLKKQIYFRSHFTKTHNLCQNVATAQMVKLVDTPDLGSGAVRCVGSSPILGNTLKKMS